MHGAKTRHTGRLLLKKEAVAPSDKHGWIDPIDTVEAGETASVLAVQESMRVCLCLQGWAVPWSAVCEPFCIRVTPMCLILLCVCGLRPADQREARSSSDNRQPGFVSLPRLASLLCFIPRSQAPAEGEKSFYLPAAAASHSLLLALSLSQSYPSLLGSPPPPIRFLVTPALALTLSPFLIRLLVNSFPCHKHTHLTQKLP